MKNIILLIALVIALAVGFVAGYKFEKFYYFNDDNDVKNMIEKKAIGYIAQRLNVDDKSEFIREFKEIMHSDFFRTKTLVCVRFMPRRTLYGHVHNYCQNLINKEVTYSNY